MPATNAEVLLILDTSLSTTIIDQMLVTAENIVATHIDPLASAQVTTAVRDDIKIWLAAHFCAIRDPRAKEESADGVRTVFEGKADMGLAHTRYGQQAILIDPTGELGKLNSSKRRRLRYKVSEPRDESTDV